MSSSKLDTSGVFQPATVHTPPTQLNLSSNEVRIRKNGIEFRSARPLSAWTEMTVGLESKHSDQRVHFTGVVVSCQGNRQKGYLVSMLFTNVSRQSQERLSSMMWA